MHAMYLNCIYTCVIGNGFLVYICLGEELKKQFKEHGTFGALEIYVSKKSVKNKTDRNTGGWYTKLALQKEGYSKTLGCNC